MLNDTTINGCFMCPIYDKGQDFEYGYKMFESAIQNGLGNNLYFIFSGAEQEKKFMGHCKETWGETPGSVVMEENLSNCKNPVSIKKIYGLKKLQKKFDYIAAIDCECIFLKKFDPGEIMDEIWRNETYLSCNIALVRIIHKCAEGLGLLDDSKIVEATGNFKYTWWFNEIPVYKTETLDEFFDWLDEKDRYNIVYNNWNCFDYYVYVMWLIMKFNKKTVKYDYKAYGGIVEELCNPVRFFKRKIEKDFGSHWTSNRKIDKTNAKLCLQFHRDHVNYALIDCLRYIKNIYLLKG